MIMMIIKLGEKKGLLVKVTNVKDHTDFLNKQ